MEIVFLRYDHLVFLQNLVQKQLSREVCGLLLGYQKNRVYIVTSVIEIKNVHEHPDVAYLLDPQEMASWFITAEKQGKNVLGVFHSHPTGNTTPSQTDLNQAWPNFVYLILAIKNKQIQIQAWGYLSEPKKFQELQLLII